VNMCSILFITTCEAQSERECGGDDGEYFVRSRGHFGSTSAARQHISGTAVMLIDDGGCMHIFPQFSSSTAASASASVAMCLPNKASSSTAAHAGMHLHQCQHAAVHACMRLPEETAPCTLPFCFVFEVV
jgi:hypothetical protein